MAGIRPGRWTHDHDGGVVVFLIGMRVNKPWRVRAWWQPFTAMPRMLRELSTHPELGFLGATGGVRGRGALMVTYWRDLESLLAYASAAGHEHHPAWAAFNRSARAAKGAVGIWHETYVVPAGGHESLYVDMPSVGVVAALPSSLVGSNRDRARARFASAG